MPQSNDDNREREVAEEIWMMYFNDYLFRAGLISEDEKNAMQEKILAMKRKNSK